MSPQLPGIFQDQLSDFQSQIERNQQAITQARMQAAQAGELSGKQLAAAALTTLLPIAIGGALAGRYGVQAGGQAGSAGLQAFDTITSQRNQRQQQLAEAQARMLEQENRQLTRDAQSLQRQGALATFNQEQANNRAAASLAERRSRPSLTEAIQQGFQSLRSGQPGDAGDVIASGVRPDAVGAIPSVTEEQPQVIIRDEDGSQRISTYEAAMREAASWPENTNKAVFDASGKLLDLRGKAISTESAQFELQKKQDELARSERLRNKVVYVPQTRIDPDTYKNTVGTGLVVFDDALNDESLEEARKKAEQYSLALRFMGEMAGALDAKTKGERVLLDPGAIEKARLNVIQILSSIEAAKIPEGGRDTAKIRENVEKRIGTRVDSLFSNIKDFGLSSMGIVPSLAEKLQSEIEDIEKSMIADLRGAGATYFSPEEVAREIRQRQIDAAKRKGGI